MAMNTCLDNSYKKYSQHCQHSFKYLFQDLDPDVQSDLCLLSAQGQDQDLVPHLNLLTLTWINSKISIITHPWSIRHFFEGRFNVCKTEKNKKIVNEGIP